MYCPVDAAASTLHPIKVGGVRLDGCGRCGGVLVRRSHLSQLVAGEVDLEPVPKQPKTRPRSPFTGRPMTRVRLVGSAGSLELDLDEVHDQVWLEAGELEELGEVASRVQAAVNGRKEAWHERETRRKALTELYGLADPLATHPQDEQSAFIARVYRLVAHGVGLSVVSATLWGLLAMVSLVAAIGVLVVGVIAWFVVLFMMLGARRERRGERGLYYAFTLIGGIVIAPLPVLLVADGLAWIVFGVLGLTMAIFYGLSKLVFDTGMNLEHWGGRLYGILILLIVFDVVVLLMAIGGLFGPASYTIAILCSSIVGALLFCGFIMFDTSRLLHKAEAGDEVLMATELYLDFINLFLELLRIAAILADAFD